MPPPRKPGTPTPALAANRRYKHRADVRERDNLRTQARWLALSALARKHPAEFTRLYLAELEYLGVAPPQMERPCACGGTIQRKAPTGMWPTVCATCGEAGRRGKRRIEPPAEAA